MVQIDLRGKVALVTGGNRGIGKSVALALAKSGATVCITGRNRDLLASAGSELQSVSTDSFWMESDVRDQQSQAKVFHEILKRHQRLDICVPNAGSATLATATRTALEQWREDIDTNLTGVYITATEALKIMSRQKSGNIIGIVSKAGTTAFLMRAAYCASKWGARGFLKCLALEAEKSNVKVTALCPASVATDFQKDNPMGTGWMMSPEAVADAVLYILSLETNAYVDEWLISTWLKPEKNKDQKELPLGQKKTE